MTHKLVLVKQTENSAEWECPVCERRIRLGLDGSGLKILKPGEQLINHGSATTQPGLSVKIGAVETADSEEIPSNLH